MGVHQASGGSMVVLSCLKSVVRRNKQCAFSYEGGEAEWWRRWCVASGVTGSPGDVPSWHATSEVKTLVSGRRGPLRDDSDNGAEFEK